MTFFKIPIFTVTFSCDAVVALSEPHAARIPVNTSSMLKTVISFFIVIPPSVFVSIVQLFLSCMQTESNHNLILKPFKTEMVGYRSDDRDDNDHAKDCCCIADVAAILKRLT